MENRVLENIKNQLQRRVDSLRDVHNMSFLRDIAGLVDYIENTEILKAITDELVNNNPQCYDYADKALKSSAHDEWLNLRGDEKSAFTCLLIKKIDETNIYHLRDLIQLKPIASRFKSLNIFIIDNFIIPLINYIYDKLETFDLHLYLFQRFKKKCEWFRKKELYDLYNEDTSKGEKQLALRICEYFFDQGVDVAIEPKSPRDMCDIVNFDPKKPLNAEVKIFSGKRDNIIKGFSQIYEYTKQHNVFTGYLIVFNVDEKDLVFSLTDNDGERQYLSHNGKTIYPVVININPDMPSPSKRGRIDSKYLITKDQIINYIETEESAQ